jgi:hypothetical protein
MNIINDASLILTPNGYKEGKLYSLKPYDGSGDFDVVRNTKAWRRDSNGIWVEENNNIPRLHYPVGGGCPSVLVEPQRTNLLLRSQEFDNASWLKERTTVNADVIISPDGTSNADKILETNVTNSFRVRQSLLLNIGNHSYSVYAKAAERSKLRIFIGVVNQSVDFDLVTQQVIDSTSLASGLIIDEGNGWYRCVMFFTTTSNVTHLTLIALLNDDGDFSYTGDSNKGLYLWQAQLEEGTTATSIIPTNGSTVTRNADIANLPTIEPVKQIALISKDRVDIYPYTNVLSQLPNRKYDLIIDVTNLTQEERLELIGDKKTNITSFNLVVDTSITGAGTVSNTDQFQFTGALGYYDVEAYQEGNLVATFENLSGQQTITLPSVGVYELRVEPNEISGCNRIQFT